MAACSTVRPQSLSALDAIFTRRSVRSYTGARLDRATVTALLDAAVQAPTAMHLEPWAFAVVQDPVLLTRISDRAKSLWQQTSHERDLHVHGTRIARSGFVQAMADPSFSIFYDAGTLVVICARPMGPFVAADCWLAAENLMLAACAMGLGTCCIGSAVSALNTRDVKTDLGIPADVVAVASVVVGVPGPADVSEGARKSPHVISWR